MIIAMTEKIESATFWSRNYIKQFDVHSQLIRSVRFLSNDGNDTSNEGKKEWKGFYLPPESASLFFNSSEESIFPNLYFDMACKQLRFKPKKCS